MCFPRSSIARSRVSSGTRESASSVVKITGRISSTHLWAEANLSLFSRDFVGMSKSIRMGVSRGRSVESPSFTLISQLTTRAAKVKHTILLL